MEFTGILADIYAFIFLVTTWVIIILGAYVVWSWFIFEVLGRYVFNFFRVYRYFVAYIWFHREFKEWYEDFRLKAQAQKEQEQKEFVERVKTWFTNDNN
ncbi:hypothetical protein GO755_30545 [Spirosoma sp. HMF4905]|uniref:Uncharacterized protein n=1 Tax=Spirosoma arboris TaxID=2682092 RepID=A0A7K1SKS0_9BACT|nr:hypothetical protein [Spirosoma arboris]MVM34411.1 hypothetical protein [Spirosoma arboris]